MLECDATFVAFPAHDGEMGVLSHRAPLVCKLGIGPMRIESEGSQKTIYIDGGFAEVSGDKLTILTEQAKELTDIDVEAAGQALIEARAMKITDDASHSAREKAVKRAKVQITLSKRA